MKLMQKIIAAALLALLLAACSKPEPPPAYAAPTIPPEAQGIPPHLREIMEANRAIALPPFPDDFRERANAFLTQGLTGEGDIRVHSEKSGARTAPGQHIREIRRENRPASLVSREDAAADARHLFDLMKYGYAGYRYFGGDEVFLPILDSALERIAEMEDPMPGVSLAAILLSGLETAIQDYHFQINYTTLGASAHGARMSEEFVLRKGRDGFVAIIDNVEYRLVEATLDGQKVEGVLPTLTPEGEAAFAFGHFADWERMNSRDMRVILESVDAGERLELGVRLRPMSILAAPTVLLHEFRANDVPVVVNRTLSDSYLTRDPAGMFRESGASLRGSPVVVLDLRGHGGGVASPMLAWIEALAGRRPSGSAFGRFDLLSIANGQGGVRAPVWRARVMPFASAFLNESLIIALTDNNIASGGDQIVGYLRELENVIFVGANTKGALVTGGVVRNVLPRSGITVIFGVQLHLRPDFSQFEGVGFMPDLWVPPDQSLHRALAFIERYGLNRVAR